MLKFDLEEMPCTHPRGCVVSASHVEGVVTTCHCGWCASITRAEAAERRVATLKKDLPSERFECALAIAETERRLTRKIAEKEWLVTELRRRAEAAEKQLSEAQGRIAELERQLAEAQAVLVDAWTELNLLLPNDDITATVWAAIWKHREAEGCDNDTNGH